MVDVLRGLDDERPLVDAAMNALVDTAAVDGELAVSVDGSPRRVFTKAALPAADPAGPPRKPVSAAKDPRVAAAVAQGRLAAEKDSGLLANRSLFIFSEENFIRKYAKIIIEWGYPLFASCVIGQRYLIHLKVILCEQ